MEGENALFSQRSVLEEQDPATLLLLREKLHNKVARTLGEIALVSDVLDGYGTVPYHPGDAYDASEDIYFTTEHPEDDRWIIRGTE